MMNKKLFNWGNQITNYLFNFLFGLAFIFALTFPNLIIGDNKITGAGTTMVTTAFVAAVVVIVFGIIVYPKIRQGFRWLFVSHKLVTASVILGLVVIWQIIFIINVHPVIGFDAGTIHFALTNTSDIETRIYYGMYYNNIMLLLMQHQIAVWFHSTSWLLMDFVTLLMVDISAALNLWMVRIVKKEKMATAMYIHAGWLVIFPMIIVPYTDTWVLPFVSGYLLCYLAIRFGNFKPIIKLLFAVLFGLLLSGSYFIKPSAIIPVIAIVLIELLYGIKHFKLAKVKLVVPTVDRLNHWINQLLTFKVMIPLLMVISPIGGYLLGNNILNNQNYIIVNRSRATPAIHFISMGVSGDGGYNAKDALMMAKLPTKAARSEYSKDLLISRLKQKGAVGYAMFLLKKQRNNTADGTFSWVKEGHFINENAQPTNHGFAGKLRQFVYLYGTHLGDFRFLAQFWWIIWLGMIMFGWRNQQKLVQILRLAIVGGMLYLLIFEGGRSRYLIQFFPVLLLLATLLVDDTIEFLRKIYHLAFVQKPKVE